VNREYGAISRIDPATNKVTQTVAVGPGLCAGLIADFSRPDPRCRDEAIARVGREDERRDRPHPGALSDAARSCATGVGSVWVVADAKGTIARIDPVEKSVVALIDTAPGAIALAFGGDALWVASASSNLVTRVNPFNNLIVETIAVPNQPRDIATGSGAVWTWNQGDGSVTRIDPKTNTVTTTIGIAAPVGRSAHRLR
jgi:YVTN family beta-propeller protein